MSMINTRVFRKVYRESNGKETYAVSKGKYLSCGFVVRDTNTGKFLGCHPTGSMKEFYDIPKGHMDVDETELEAATRELYEETNISLGGTENVIELGRFDYKPQKDLYLFYVELPVDLNKLKCNSLFTDSKGNKKPEMNGYILLDGFDKYLFGLRDILRKVI